MNDARHSAETEDERVNRELDQLLLQELRVAMPGVQVLFAFLLAGLAALAIAMNGAILLVTDLMFKDATVVITIVMTALLFVGLWFPSGSYAA